ncbi:MAG: hypothetical protein N3E42_00160 [Candidatus Bipolaricaulota bacterium]|nr:hypothetical protein [Candidatus Bipolaricaulota bacterium]
MRRSAVAGLLTVALATVPVLAQPQIESVELGFNGRFLPGALTPLSVTLRHSGPAQNFTLEVSQEVRDFTERSLRERLRLPISLGLGARKTLSFDFPIKSVSTPVRIALLAGEREIALTEIDVRERWSENALVVGLAVQPMPAIEPIEPERLPRRWTSYDGVARILWGRLDPARLTAEQRTAMLGWLVRGGELIILSGENWHEQFSPGEASPETAQGWWAHLLPITNGRIVRRALNGQEVSWVEGALRAGARVVTSDAGRPLIWERPLGHGRVLLVALATLPETIRLPERNSDKVFEQDQLIVKALGALVVPFPSREVIGGLLLAFIVGVGLGGILASRRTVSLWIALASGVLSLAIFQYQHSAEFSHEKYSVHLGVVRIWAGEPIAWEQDWYGVFSRRSGEGILPISADCVRSVAWRAAMRPTGTVTVEVASPRMRVLRFHSERDSVRFFAAERMTDPPVQFTVNRAVSPPQIHVYNRSSLSLQDAVVRIGNDFYKVGPIAPQTELIRPLSEMGRISKTEWLTSLPEGRRLLWHQWGAESVGPTLIGWFEAGSVWAKMEREARTVVRLVTVDGGAL